MAYLTLTFALMMGFAGIVVIGQNFTGGGALCGSALVLLIIGAIVANRRPAPRR